MPVVSITVNDMEQVQISRIMAVLADNNVLLKRIHENLSPLASNTILEELQEQIRRNQSLFDALKRKGA